MTTYYSFTVKANHIKYPQEEDYEEWLQNAVLKNFNQQCYFYELDSKNKLHMHGIALSDKNLFKQKLLYKNYHQRIDSIPSFMDLKVYSDYIQKDFVNQDEYQQKLDTYRIQTMQYPFQ